MTDKKPFSKLKKQIENLFDPILGMEFCCNSYPIRGQWGHNNSIPRFFIRLNKEVIWDFPKDFEIKKQHFGYWADNNNISALVREYIDTDVLELPDKKFESELNQIEINNFDNNNQGIIETDYKLTEIFKAADRRIGKKRLMDWSKTINNPIVEKIINLRFAEKTTEEILNTFLMMPDGRERAIEYGIEKMFDAEIERLRKKLPHVSFSENSILGFDQLAKQPPMTFKQMKAQVQWLKSNSNAKNKKRRD